MRPSIHPFLPPLTPPSLHPTLPPLPPIPHTTTFLQVRAAIEKECALIAEGYNDKASVVERNLTAFKEKFMNFRQNVDTMRPYFTPKGGAGWCMGSGGKGKGGVMGKGKGKGKGKGIKLFDWGPSGKGGKGGKGKF